MTQTLEEQSTATPLPNSSESTESAANLTSEPIASLPVKQQITDYPSEKSVSIVVDPQIDTRSLPLQVQTSTSSTQPVDDPNLQVVGTRPLQVKDNWDKLAAIAPIISGTLIFLMGGFFTYTFNQQQLKLQEIQTIEKFIPHLMGNEQSKKAAILAIKNLTNAELAGKFANIFASSGTVSALQTMAENGTPHDKTVAENALADALRSLEERENKLSGIEKSYEEALAKTKLSGSINDAGTLYQLSKLGDTYKMNGRFALAEAALKKSLATKEQVYGQDNPEVAEALRSLAELYQMSGKPTEADSCLKRAQSIEAKYKYPQETELAPAAPAHEGNAEESHPGATTSGHAAIEKSEALSAETKSLASEERKAHTDDQSIY